MSQFLVILLIVTIKISFCVKSNVCKRSIDYFYMDNNPNCWHNPDVNATLTDIIKSKGYPFVSYKIKSKDGYITDLFRIKRSKPNKGVVYLLHPATATSGVWIDKGVNGSFAFLLYDAGFDVWMGNSRGSDYGRGHVSLNENDTKYWDFGFHEMGVYDLPVSLEFIKKMTDSKVAFVGHSMGGTVAFIYASLKPTHAKNHVNVFVLLSAGGFFKNVKLPGLHYISNYVNIAYDALKVMNFHALASKYEYDFVVRLALQFCNTPYGYNVCIAFIKQSLGVTDDYYDPSYIPVLFNQYPGGVPTKAYIHYGQWLQNNGDNLYNMFDYGNKRNRKIYKMNRPPKYPIKNITTPTYLWYGTNDWLSTPEGTEEFYDILPKEAKIYGKQLIDGYNHGDFLFARNVADVAYKPLIKFFESII